MSSDRGATEPRPAPSDGGRPRLSRRLRSQLLIALLCLVLGFAIVTQVRETQGDEFAGMRQDELARLLEVITQRNEELEQEAADLRQNRAELLSGSDASDQADEYLELQQILAGVAPVEGPGVIVELSNTSQLAVHDLVHLLEELRNAGAEAVEVNGVRIVAASYVGEEDGALTIDGVVLDDRQEWRVIGNPDTLMGALEIPGGALPTIRSREADVQMTERDLVQITAIRTVREPEYAKPDPEAG